MQNKTQSYEIKECKVILTAAYQHITTVFIIRCSGRVKHAALNTRGTCTMIQKGQQYDSFDALQEAVDKYCTESKCRFIIVDKITVQRYNARKF